MAERPPRGEGPKPLWSEMGQYAHLGFQLALSTGLFLAAGWWVDGAVGTTPILTILGALVGAAAGFYSMIHQLVIQPRQRQEAKGEPGNRET